MKNRIVFMIALCFSFLSVSAQDFSIGVKGGINIASIGGGGFSGFGGLGSKIAFHVGGVVEIPVTDKFSAQPELLYSSQGTQWDLRGSSGLRLDYLNLPVLVKYTIIKGLSAEAGPVVGLLLATNEEKENYNTIDVGIAVGASYKLNENIFFSLRYNKGITDIHNDEAVSFSNQNNVFQLSAGYSF